MFSKKGHGWFWYAFWSLVAAAAIYLVARFFGSTTDSYHNKKSPRSDKKSPSDKDALFI
jgi:hypothetical protein